MGHICEVDTKVSSLTQVGPYHIHNIFECLYMFYVVIYISKYYSWGLHVPTLILSGGGGSNGDKIRLTFSLWGLPSWKYKKFR